MLRIHAVPKSRQQLEMQSQASNANQPEAIPWVYYDTQAIASAATGPISFFANPNNDKTLSNIEQGGTIPDPYYFEIDQFNLDFLVRPSVSGANTVVGVYDDLAQILHTARATVVFSIAGKEYLRIPATFLHCSGGPTGGISASLTAPQAAEFALNGYPGVGFYMGKAVVLPPKQSFGVQLTFGAAVGTLISTPINTRMSMAGVLHRRVL